MKVKFDPVALGIDVKIRTATGNVLARCPFHGSHSPTLSFSTTKGLFYCFSCGESGNAEKLAKETGGIVTSGDYALNEEAKANIDEFKILSLPLALDNKYLKIRGVTDAAIKKYDIRQTNDAVVFPVFDLNKKLIGANYRLLPSTIKKANENGVKVSKYFFVGHNTPLWPMIDWRLFSNGKGGNRIVLVEGMFGVLNAFRHNVKALSINGAAFGRNRLSPYIKRLQVNNEVIALFDDDSAGYIALFIMMRYFGVSALIPAIEADMADENDWQLVKNGYYRNGLAQPSPYELARFVPLHQREKFINRCFKYIDSNHKEKDKKK